METDKKLIDFLKENPNSTTYEVAKRLGISWSTANMHLFKLMAFGKIKGKEVESYVGTGKKMIWWV